MTSSRGAASPYLEMDRLLSVIELRTEDNSLSQLDVGDRLVLLIAGEKSVEIFRIQELRGIRKD